MATHPEHRELRPHHGHADVQGTDVPLFMNSYRGASAVSTLRRFFVESEGQRGQAMLEFALVLPVVLLVITGVFDVARAVWQENTLAYAAREGTRYAIVHGSGYCSISLCPDNSGIVYPSNTQPVIDVVRRSAVGIGGNINVTVCWPDNESSPGACNGRYDRNYRVQVVATTQFVPLPSYYMLGSAFQITLKGGSMLVIQR